MNTKASTGSYRGRMGVLALASIAGLSTSAFAQGGEAAGGDPFSAMPATITLQGVVRDFKAREQAGGHPDFQRQPTQGFGHYVGMVADSLDADGKPVYAGTGRKLNSNYRDAQGRNIMPPRPHFPAMQGDIAGSVSTTAGGALTSADALSQWFRDVPGVNASQTLDLTLVRASGSNRYVFNDQTDANFAGQGGFFPINGAMYGNYQNNKNFHFTFELDTEFVYQQGSGQVFTFTGDDDVWVFIDGKCVIDIGGVHSAVSQTIALDRLSWLQSGETYSLRFFFAERHTTQSNFRIETTLALRNVEPPTTTALHD